MKNKKITFYIFLILSLLLIIIIGCTVNPVKENGKDEEVLKPNRIPKNLTISEIDANIVTLVWDKVSGATSYKIYLSKDNNVYNQIDLPSITTNSCIVGGLDENTKYYFKISSLKDSEESSFSNVVNTFTLITSPQDFKVIYDFNSNCVILSWYISNFATKYKIYRSENDISHYDEIPYFIISQPSTSTCTITDSDVIINTDYYYKIIAVNDNTSSSFSDNINVNINKLFVNDFEIAYETESSIKIQWNMNPYISGYEVWENTVNNINTYYKVSRVFTATQTYYEVTGLGRGESRYFNIRSYVNNGNIITYGSFLITPLEGITKPNPPSFKSGNTYITENTGNIVNDNYQSKITLSWEKPSGNVDRIRIYKSSIPFNNILPTNFIERVYSSTTWADNEKNFTDSGLDIIPNSKYYYIILSGLQYQSDYNKVTTGVLSELKNNVMQMKEFGVRTLPPPPTNLTAEVDGNNINLTWKNPVIGPPTILENYDYIIEYKIDNVTNWKPIIITDSTKTSHTIEHLGAAKDYVIRISTNVNLSDTDPDYATYTYLKSIYSPEVNCKTTLDKPGNFTAIRTANAISVTLKWDVVTAEGQNIKYKLQKSTDGTSWSEIYDGASLSRIDSSVTPDGALTLPPPTKYYYQLMAYVDGGAETENSGWKSSDPDNLTVIVPSTVLTTTYYSTLHIVKLSWTVITGADGYEITRQKGTEAPITLTIANGDNDSLPAGGGSYVYRIKVKKSPYESIEVVSSSIIDIP